MTEYGSGNAPLAVAHRGGSGLATENTLAAIERSVALGIRHIEVDVRLTGDGIPVLFHDASLGRLTGRRLRIADLTLAQLSSIALPGGHRVPTLAEILVAFPSCCFMIDIKDPAAIDDVLDAAYLHGIESGICLTNGWDRRYHRMRKGPRGEVATALGWDRMAALLAAGLTGLPLPSAGAPFAHVPLRWGMVPFYTRGAVRRAHDLGQRILVWGVDDAPTMERLLDDGVDGIITDRPDLLRDLLIARGQWFPHGDLENGDLENGVGSRPSGP